jgi:ketosteroid isomerase-like protein
LASRIQELVMGKAKDAAVAVWQAFASGDADQIRRAFTEDGTWIAPPGNATAIASGATAEDIRTVDGIIGFITGAYLRLFPAEREVKFLRIVEDGDVAVFEQVFKARLANGRMYENRYCWVFETRDGKVSCMREYMDTHAGFGMIFGDEAPRRIID